MHIKINFMNNNVEDYLLSEISEEESSNILFFKNLELINLKINKDHQKFFSKEENIFVTLSLDINQEIFIYLDIKTKNNDTILFQICEKYLLFDYSKINMKYLIIFADRLSFILNLNTMEVISWLNIDHHLKYKGIESTTVHSFLTLPIKVSNNLLKIRNYFRCLAYRFHDDDEHKNCHSIDLTNQINVVDIIDKQINEYKASNLGKSMLNIKYKDTTII